MHTFIAKAENGSINWGSDYNLIRLERLCKLLEGKTLKIEVAEQKSVRSIRQNSYYWGCVVPAVMEMYNKAVRPEERLSMEDTHELLKREFNFRYVRTKEGQAKIGRSTRTLSTLKFGEYIDRIKHWADENGCYIPDPDPELSHDNASFIRPLTPVA